MRNKVYPPVEIDFDSLSNIETSKSKLLFAINKVKALPNPYVGNKRKLIYQIWQFLQDEHIEYNSILDLFSGSACISIVMKLLGKQVITNDLLKSSFSYALSFVQNNDFDLSLEDKKYILCNINSNATGFVQSTYSNRFTFDEAKFLDNFRANIEDISYYKKYLAIANLQIYLMDHCFVGGRLNHGQVLADLAHRQSHNRNKQYKKGMNFNDIYWYKFFCPENNNCHFAFNLPVFDFLNNSKNHTYPAIDLAYIDPPYGGDQSDYVHMFRFFEEFILGRPLNSLDNQIIYGKDFADKKTYENNFIEMIKLLNFIPYLVISYNDSSWANISKITDILQSFRKFVKVKVCEDYKYKYRSSDNTLGKEYIILTGGAK